MRCRYKRNGGRSRERVLTSGALGLRVSGGRANDGPSTARARVVTVWTSSPRPSETLMRAGFPQGVRPNGRASASRASEGARQLTSGGLLARALRARLH
jgi:hypothetical protein